MIKKSRFLLFVALISSIMIMANASGLNSLCAELDYTGENNGVTVYYLDYDSFNEFTANPSEDILKQKVNNTATDVFSKNTAVYNENGRNMKIGRYLPVYASLVDFVNDRGMLEKFLNDNGFAGNIENVSMLEIQNMPVTIWLKTDNSNYFITVDERYDDVIGEDGSKYVYRLYTYPDYCGKFGDKDGKLIVNGKDITDGNYVKVNYSGAYIPLRPVMENLGAVLEWNAETNSVLIFCNGKKYVFDIDNHSLYEAGTSNNMLIPPPGGGEIGYCKITDGRTIMNDYTLRVFIRLMDAKINVDYDNLTVEIMQ